MSCPKIKACLKEVTQCKPLKNALKQWLRSVEACSETQFEPTSLPHGAHRFIAALTAVAFKISCVRILRRLCRAGGARGLDSRVEQRFLSEAGQNPLSENARIGCNARENSGSEWTDAGHQPVSARDLGDSCRRSRSYARLQNEGAGGIAGDFSFPVARQARAIQTLPLSQKADSSGCSGANRGAQNSRDLPEQGIQTLLSRRRNRRAVDRFHER